MLRADIKPIVDGEAARCAASPSISVLTYLRIAIRIKMVEYMAIGLRLGWLINPQDQQVEVYRAGRAVEVVSMPTVLFGEDVLPGFECL